LILLYLLNRDIDAASPNKGGQFGAKVLEDARQCWCPKFSAAQVANLPMLSSFTI
jgi:hypothetical protein